ncbi:acyl-[ACP]--phospholipid O-acyltransferase, partial [Campylobacter coli]
SFILSTLIKENSKKINSNFERGSYAPKEECVGILLPASFASSLLNLSVLLAQKVVVNLNFTAGEKALQAAVKSAQISQIYTSKKFLEKLESKGVSLNFGEEVNLIYMEDVVEIFKKQKSKILAMMMAVSIL